MKILKSLAALFASLSIPHALTIAGVVGVGSVALPTPAWADRCTLDSATGTYACSMIKTTQAAKTNLASCNGLPTSRAVSYQVPEGTPPAGGWPVAFYYNGLGLAQVPPPDGPVTFGPFDPNNDSSGARYLTATLHELLDDPGNTGKKYAVFFPSEANTLGTAFWETNIGTPYDATGDYCFLPAMWASIQSGGYGPASQHNMSRRFAFGMSSGGYNTSRMAVSWNSDNVWKALAIHSASYASCLGPVCTIPTDLPANHPPTKFWHGSADPVVPIATMYQYYNALIAQGHVAEVQVGDEGHSLSPDWVGPTGVKAWFDRF